MWYVPGRGLELILDPPLEPFPRGDPQAETALIWMAKFLAFALVLGHFLPAELWQVLVGVMGAELSSVLPFHGIAGSGTCELAVLLPLGVEAATALAGAVNLHLFLLGMTLLLGALALLLPVSRRAAPGRVP